MDPDGNRNEKEVGGAEEQETINMIVYIFLKTEP